MNENDDNEINDLLEPDIATLLGDSSLWLEPSARWKTASRTALPKASRRGADGRAGAAWPGRLTAAALGAAAAAAACWSPSRATRDQQADARDRHRRNRSVPQGRGKAGITAEHLGHSHRRLGGGPARRDGGDFYQGWLKNCEGTELIPIGTFHELDDATGWAGVFDRRLPGADRHPRAGRAAQGRCAGLVRRGRRQRCAEAVSGLSAHATSGWNATRRRARRARRARRCPACRWPRHW